MPLKECYEMIGGEYFDVINRLLGEERVKKFVIKFLDDKNFEIINSSLENKNYQKAFLAAHTLKGTSLNLGFTQLASSSSKVIEALKPGSKYNEKNILNLFQKLKNDYEITVFAIKNLT